MRSVWKQALAVYSPGLGYFFFWQVVLVNI